MARPLRVEYPGAVYHVMSRGNDRQDIFFSSSDQLLFLNTLSDICQQTGWRIHAYALMPNHYHLLLETPEANLVAGMKWFQGTYTQRFNLRHNRSGHLYQGRYKSLPVDPVDASYFRKVGNYIHLNPVRARLVSGEPQLSKDPLLCSYPYYAGSAPPPPWFETKRLLACCLVDGAKGYRAWMTRMVSAGEGKEDEAMKTKGWFHGSDEFKKFLNSQIDGAVQRNYGLIHGNQRADHGIERAESLLKAAFQKLGLDETEILKRKAVDVEKQAIAWLIKQNTTVTVSWIAERLSLGHRVNASRAIKRFCETQDDRGVDTLKGKMLQCLG